VWGFISAKQTDAFKQIFHALIGRDFQCPWIGQGFEHFELVISTKNDIFGNWTKHYMCGDSYMLNKHTHLSKYFMPLLEEIFNGLG
jgi:hypothetical protein